jgi:voltage-gated potassium channel
VGVLGYSRIEGWPLFDSLFMTVITLTTVGYGETHPLDHAGKVFTIFLIITGVSIVAYGISTLTAFFVEGELSDVLRRRRMQGKVDGMKGHFILCGAGHTGRVILQELLATGRSVVVIEKSEAEHHKLLLQEIPAVPGDAMDDDVLKSAGIDRAAGLFAALGTDRDNAFVALTARGLNAKIRIVCEQVEKDVEDKLKRSGADAVVRPSRIGGLRMASEMIRPVAVGFMDAMLREEQDVFRIEEVPVPAGSPLAGKRIGEIKGGEGNAALVLAVRRAGQDNYLFNPPSDLALAGGEVLVIMGTMRQKEELAKKLRA